jgi:hypothetical protein
MMGSMNRTFLVFLLLIPDVFVIAIASEALGLEGWAETLFAVALVMPLTLIDREGFYGTPPRRTR